MPELSNRRQELFCKFLASGDTTQANAYELAGYTPSTSNASVLANKPEIAQRVAELRAENERKENEYRIALHKAGLDEKDPEGERRRVEEWNLNTVRELLHENARLAQVAGQFQAAKECIKLIGDTMGAFNDGPPEKGKLPAAGAGGGASLTLNLNGLQGTPSADAEPAAHNPLAPKPKK